MANQTVTFNDAQQVVVTSQPVDSSGSNAVNFNPATWVSDTPTVCAVKDISADGLTATIYAVSAGTANITVTGEQGNFMPSYSSTFAVTVTASVPVAFVFTFGTPVPLTAN